MAFAEENISIAFEALKEAVSQAENLPEKADYLESRLKENLSKAEIALANQGAEGEDYDSPEFIILI